MSLAVKLALCSIACLVWLPALALTGDVSAAAPGSSDTKARKGLNLFHAGEDSLAWDNHELDRMRSLHTKDLNNVEEFMGARNLADFLGLEPLESLHLPVPLNVILVGFAGDGNAGVNISLWELNHWFEHLDHILPHTRIDRSELTCQEDGQCAGLVHGRLHPTPMPSYVHLNFTCNVVLVKRRNVVDAFERAIAAFSRPVDPAVPTGAQQVDAAKMEALIDHFIMSLGLETSYSIVVMNPTWHVDEPVYGYRLGVSQLELQQLKSNVDRLRKVMTAFNGNEPSLPGRPRGGWHSSRPAWPHGNVVAPKFAERDSSWESERWVTAVATYLGQEEQTRRALLDAAGPERGAAAMVQAARLLARPGSVMGSMLRKDLLEPWGVASDELHSTFHTSHPAEDCLVNTWVGSAARWVLLDLTAGGKDWGPALGGEGVVHQQTLPSVAEMFGTVKKLKQEVRREAQTPGTSEALIADSLSQARAARLPSVANRHHHAYWLKKQASQRAAEEPGAPPLDPEKEAEEERAWRVQHHMVLLQAELDVLEEWALRYCNNNESPPLVCGTWKEEATALRAGLAKLHSASSPEAVYELFRDHKWEIFGTEQDLTDWKPQLWDEEEISHDLLLSELAGAMSRAIRHVIAPPTASWAGRRVVAPSPAAKAKPGRSASSVAAPGAGPAAGGPGGAEGAAAAAAAAWPRHATAPPFAYQVNFHMYLISDKTRDVRNSNAALAAFDLDSYKLAVEDLRLPNQLFHYHVNKVNLLDEPALASGVAAATRTTLQEIPTSEDFFDAEMERVYIDSAELAATLRRHFPPTKKQLAREEAASRAAKITLTAPTRDVAVYILQLERDVAVLLDEHYNARALEDMILVVANSARRDEHPTGMMCGGLLVARPISPLKESLAATLLHLGGVLPPHLGYNPRSHTVTHDWLWSVGAHPLSFTSTGQTYTVMQRDALARSYLLDALDTSVEAVNAAIGQLVRAKTNKQSFKHVKDNHHGVRELLKRFGEVVSTYRSTVAMAYSLDYPTALDYVRSLEAAVNTLTIHAVTVATLTEPVHCSGHIVDRVALLVPVSYLGSAGVALMALLWAVLPRLTMRKAKAM